jgi:hypothetical protein
MSDDRWFDGTECMYSFETTWYSGQKGLLETKRLEELTTFQPSRIKGKITRSLETM